MFNFDIAQFLQEIDFSVCIFKTLNEFNLLKTGSSFRREMTLTFFYNFIWVKTQTTKSGTVFPFTPFLRTNTEALKTPLLGIERGNYC